MRIWSVLVGGRGWLVLVPRWRRARVRVVPVAVVHVEPQAELQGRAPRPERGRSERDQGERQERASKDVTHSGEKPHECKTCGKAFSEANKLGRHMLIHTREKSHVCVTCGRAFARTDSLASHRLTHTKRVL
mmetsp:Transcript_43826/g.103268  ORF Transcript_43826/g.103268 Transcript_43826/m.103268 type:complete len:132 (-) Transcript_43826:62-457(-)